MPHLLDSDLIIDYLTNDPAATRLVAALAPTDLSMSVVSYMEAYQGIHRGPNAAANAATLTALVAIVPILPFAAAEAERCARLREALRGHGRRVHSRALDLMIAATALEHGLTLVTRNRRDYRDVPGLRLHPSS